MLVLEQHRLFDIILDKISSNAYPSIKPEEKDVFLNMAQDKLVINSYNGSNTMSPTPTVSFEETQKRKSDLNNILTDFQRVITATEYKKYNTFNKTYQIKFSEVEEETSTTYWFKVKEQITLKDKKSDCFVGEIDLPITESTNDSISRTEIDPFNKPSIYFPVVLHKEYIELYLAGEFDYTKYDITYRLRYIRKPIRISKKNNVSCELNDETHIKIVEEAVSYALESIESQRFQTQLIKDKSLE